MRRVSSFLSEREAATLLAAEADVLVYWYEERGIASASGAARLGLATGVPVLTSPTSWFDDLRDVTFQPDDLADGVVRLLEDDRLRRHLTKSAREFCHDAQLAAHGRADNALWRSLEST